MAGRLEGVGDFGQRLQSWRYKNRLTQEQLAQALGYDVTYIAKIEGGTRPASRAFLARLSQVAGPSGETLQPASVVDVARPPLPQPPDTLIGRDDVLDAIVEWIIGPARCITLVGPPGIGKTRLAMEVALRLDRVLPEGVWWVSLLDVASADDVGQQLRRAVGIADHADSDPVEAVLAQMGSQKALLVLDNFEHVIEARALVGRIVASASQLTVLVTSREALQLVSEHVFPVTVLDFPDPLTVPSFEMVRNSSAVGLFVARATMARPQFRLTPSNCLDVLGACARVDGIPLAIVLTAGAVKSIDAARLVERLDERGALSGVAPIDMPSHHKTLEAAIEWSWDLLGGEEQELFASLAVFSGGFTSAAVAALDGRQADGARALLEALASKSIVEARPDAASGPRFELLETIRSFAWSRLERSRRVHDLRRGHLAYFVAFAEDCGRRLIGPDQIYCAHAFADEFENLRVAFEWSLSEDPSSAIRLAASMWRFFFIGDIPTGRRWLAEALARAMDPTAARATALAAAGALGWVTGHPDVAADCLRDAAALAEQLGLADVGALVLVNEGALAEQQERLGDAEDRFSEALLVYERLGDRRGQAVALNGLGMVRRRQWQLEEAWQLWTEAAALFRAVGDGMNEAIALGNKAWAAEVEGRLNEARALCLDCRRIQIALGDARGLAATTAELGRIAFRNKAFGESKALHLDAVTGFHRLGDLPWVATSLLALGAVEEATGSVELAVTLLGAAEALWDQIGTRAREEEQTRLDGVVARCRDALDEGGYARAVAAGKVMTVSEAVTLAAGTPTGVT